MNMNNGKPLQHLNACLNSWKSFSYIFPSEMYAFNAVIVHTSHIEYMPIDNSPAGGELDSPGVQMQTQNINLKIMCARTETN